MKTKLILALTLCLYGFSQAQERLPLSLDQAVTKAWQNSRNSKISAERVSQAEQTVTIAKNKQYPDFGISGEYLHLNKPNLELGFSPSSSSSENGSQEGSTMPEPHYLMMAEAKVTVPLFSGFKLQNTVDASKNRYRAAQFSALSTKEDIAMHTVTSYIAIYKARKMVALITENLKSATQRVADFTAMEKNGLLPLNDLLKAKLQASNIQLTLAEAKKNARILNYRLAVFLQLPEHTKIAIDTASFKVFHLAFTDQETLSRPDLKALKYRQKAAQDEVQVEKGNYYPSIALTAGYLAADIDNTLTVTNALNVGIGLSYNLSSIFKNKSHVRRAKSKAHQLELQLNQAQDQAKIAVRNAQENYDLALQNYRVYKKSKRQAAENYRIVKDKYENGLVDTNDLLDADVQQLQSKINLAQGKAEITENYYSLKKAQGNLIEEFTNK